MKCVLSKLNTFEVNSSYSDVRIRLSPKFKTRFYVDSPFGGLKIDKDLNPQYIERTKNISTGTIGKNPTKEIIE